MRIVRFFVKNYKSFAEVGGEASLTTGINVVVGQNNVGKTALLEALSTRLKDAPHRSVRTHPTPGSVVETRPSIELDVELDESECIEIAADHGGHCILEAPSGG